jgi:hypothetical protein
MKLKLDIGVPSCAPVNQVADYVAELARIRFSGVGLPDSQLLMRDFVIPALSHG